MPLVFPNLHDTTLVKLKVTVINVNNNIHVA